MDLLRALRLNAPLLDSSRVIAFVGAGGKTTAMFQLARELVRAGPVFVTATTHLGQWQIAQADMHIIAEFPSSLEKTVQESLRQTRKTEAALPSSDVGINHSRQNGIILVTGPLEGERTQPIKDSVLSWLYEETKNVHIPLLIEADGARQRPLKAPAQHEPPIPGFAEAVIVVAGLGGLRKPLSEEVVFRLQEFLLIGGLANDKDHHRASQLIVTPEIVARALCHPSGGLKNIPAQARRICLLNQADTPELQAIAGRMSRWILNDYEAVIVASARTQNIHAAHEHVAGIVLAAGGSNRFGTMKQLLDWRGETFVRAAAGTALRAGLSPVIVVTGAEAERVAEALRGLDVQIARNEKWQSGQGSSITAGIHALPQSAGAAIFLLADQPHIGTDVIRALVETHAQTLPAVLAPLVLEERRANPVLFDRDTFSDLACLTGDMGGRAIFDKHQVAYLPWHDDTLLLDVDTPDDYERLKKL